MDLIIANTYQFLLLMGIIFLVAGLITYKFSPKKINVLYGYRTLSSMKNQARWDFAQKYSSIRMIQLAIVMIVISFSKTILKPENEMVISLSVLVACVLFLLLSTEKAIRNKFPSNVD